MSIKPESNTRYSGEVEILARRDPVLAEVTRRVGPCTLSPSEDHFRTLAEAILWQQISWRAACAIYEKVLDALGTRRPRSADILRASSATLRRAGVSRQKVQYLKGLAEYFEARKFPKKTIEQYSDDEIIRLLMEIKGVGRWTAEMYLIFGLNRLDVFPAGDLGLRKAIGRHYGFDGFQETVRLEKVITRWRPYRTIGTWYMWSSADAVPFGPKPAFRGM